MTQPVSQDGYWLSRVSSTLVTDFCGSFHSDSVRACARVLRPRACVDAWTLPRAAAVLRNVRWCAVRRGAAPPEPT